MKLSFSTLGCPDWSLDQVLTCAAENGYDGVEVRGLHGEIDLRQAPEFAPSEITATKERLDSAGCAAVCLGSSAQLTRREPEVRQEMLDEVRAYADLAATLGAPFVRVFGGNIPDGVSREDCLKCAGEALAQAGEIAAERGVKVVLETHDAFSLGVQVAELLRAADSPAVGSLWDIHHPYRQGESLQTTMECLRGTLVHTHFKDSVEEGEKRRYTLLGDGTIPVAEALQLLQDEGYDGYLSLEWEKKWHPEIDEPEVAFPQFAAKMRELLAALE
ncbi:MAG: sugar phosphate isomerase/epimerase family protein [Armatimonadota bacterium]